MRTLPSAEYKNRVFPLVTTDSCSLRASSAFRRLHCFFVISPLHQAAAASKQQRSASLIQWTAGSFQRLLLGCRLFAYPAAREDTAGAPVEHKKHPSSEHSAL